MGRLTEEQLQSYDKNGFLVIDLLDGNEFNQLCDAYKEIFDSKRQEYNLNSTWNGSWDQSKEKKVKSFLNRKSSGKYLVEIIILFKILV